MISAVSVKDRLKNQAVSSGKTFQESLTAYGLSEKVNSTERLNSRKEALTLVFRTCKEEVRITYAKIQRGKCTLNSR